MIRIEQASVEHAAMLARLNVHVHQLHVENASRFFVQPSDEERRAAFVELLSQANVRAFIAYADDTPVGYVLALIHDRAASTFNPARRWLYVDQISVEPEWEGRGVGSQLMRTIVDYARRVEIDELETEAWAFNTRARGFFRAVGFRPKSERFWMRLDT
jgi:ribosomal protein S18 acetylase RimI-like enzyme